MPPERRWAARIRFVGGAAIYAVAVVIALFSAYAAFVLMGLVAVYYIIRAHARPFGVRRGRGAGRLKVSEINSCH